MTSEYNHGYPAPLKNAIDYLNQEWRYKPVGFVSYGGVSAGTRAVQQLKQVVTAVAMFPVPAAVHIPFVAQFLDSDGVVQANEVMEQAAIGMLDELATDGRGAPRGARAARRLQPRLVAAFVTVRRSARRAEPTAVRSGRARHTRTTPGASHRGRDHDLCDGSGEPDHAADAVLALHQLEALR